MVYDGMDHKGIVPENYVLLISELQIKKRLKELGEQIKKDYTGKRPVLIGVLNGAFLFLSDLIRNIDLDLEIDFIRISSYGNGYESSGEVKLVNTLSVDIKGRPVVVVEDIVDSGNSINYLAEAISSFAPSEIRYATLLYKPAKTRSNVKLDYVGFEIDDKYVVGYGLDEGRLKRNLRNIYMLDM